MRLWTFAAVCLAAGTALAQQPAGTATGIYVTQAGTRIALRYARATFEDEASSGHPERGEYRILLTERPVGPEALERSGPNSAIELAESGALRGVLIELDTHEPGEINLIELERRPDDFGLNSRSLDGSPGPWRRLDFRPEHVGGELRLAPADGSERPDAVLTFDAAIAYDPVVAVLTGAQARDSAPAHAAVAAHEAIIAGDFDAARRLSTAAVAARMTGATLNDAERELLRNMAEGLRNPARVVIRRNSALVVMGGEGLTLSVNLALEDGQWKLAD